MSEIDDLLSMPPPKRRYKIGPFYKVGPYWVLSYRSPKYGLFHLSHHRWWVPLVTFPRAWLSARRLVRSRAALGE